MTPNKLHALKGIAFLLVVVISVLILVCHLGVTPRLSDDQRAKNAAEDLGCEYLGRTHDVPRVGFMDCGDGDIQMMRVY